MLLSETRTPVKIRPLREDDRAAWEPLWAGYLTFYESSLPADITEMTWSRFHHEGEQLFGLCAELAAFPGLQYPRVELCHVLQVVTPPGGHCLCHHGQVAARQRQMQLIRQPVGCYIFCSKLFNKYEGLQPFRV